VAAAVVVMKPSPPLNPNAPARNFPTFTVDPRFVRVNAEKLGFEPVLSRERARQLPLTWARYARIVPQSVDDEVPAL
jgi:hypothetical protein